MLGREIKRTQYIRGTRAFTVRNWIVFGVLSVSTLLSGAIIIYSNRNMEEKVKKLLGKDEELRKDRTAFNDIMRSYEEIKLKKSGKKA